MLSMKFNGMRIMSHAIREENPGLAGWIVKLQGCELNHQMASMAVDIMGELGILFEEGVSGNVKLTPLGN